MHRLVGGRWLATITLVSTLAGTAAADVEGKLKQYEQEARQIAQTLPVLDGSTGVQSSRRLVDAQVAFSLGDYDAAALILFELAGKPGEDQEKAEYYLGETLYAKGDRGAARASYAQVTASNNTGSKYYAAALLRLVEIATAQGDPTDVDATIAQIDRLSPTPPTAAYVKGKWAFSQGKYDDAVALFAAVPSDSPMAAQAKYYTATSLVAKQELPRAMEAYTALSVMVPQSPNDRRVIELSQLALGRLYYERDQPSKAIDSYLLIDRNSDLFADALYEVAWVYVKGKQFDKALRALELLNLSNPNPNRTATVRVLEGNLRIRKAQMNRDAQITNTVEANQTDPAVEYDKAAAVFSETHAAYYPSYVALSAMLESGGDPADYLAQLAERQNSVFQAVPPIPEAAAQYLREEPETQRVVANQVDLGTIQAHLTESETTIARLESVLAANDKSVIYPSLRSRRDRIGAIQRDLNAIRSDLAEKESQLLAPSGELASLTSQRQQLMPLNQPQPDGEAAHGAKVDMDRAGYDQLSEAAAEIRSAVDQSQAMAVAARKYISDKPMDGTVLVTDEVRASTKTELVAAAGELTSIEAELTQLKAEITMGRDLAGSGDADLGLAIAHRMYLKEALDAEHRALAGFASASRDAGKSRKLVALGDQAMRVSDDLQATEIKIDAMVDQALGAAKETLAKERTNVDAYRAELNEYELESRAIGGTILGASFANVKAKFYDVIVRTDVGSIDVVWSQKEDADDQLKRLNLSRSRELKLITDEFKDILDASQMVLPAAAIPLTPPPPTSTGAPMPASPDRGPTERVKAGTEDVPKPATPTVKPDSSQGTGVKK